MMQWDPKLFAIALPLVSLFFAPASGASCLADALGELRLIPTVPKCSESLEDCRKQCDEGEAPTCVSLAYAMQRTSSTRDQAEAFFERACRLGVANACTNLAAGIWSSDHTPEQLACAVRLFRRACKTGEHFACGMAGRSMLAEASSPEDFAASRAYLEEACKKPGGFACRVLAKHLEAGDLGEYPPAQIPALLERACETGDPDGCGPPATAAETFR